MTERRRLDELSFDTPGMVSAGDDGDHVYLWAYVNYGDEPAVLNAEQATQLRDWLTAWLERQ